jgi:two-component system NtrC family sensor kinase
MPKAIIFSILFIFSLHFVFAQPLRIDSLETILHSAPNDTVRLTVLTALEEAYSEEKPDSALYFDQELLKIAQKLKLPLYEAYANTEMAYALMNRGDYPGSLKVLLTAKSIAEDPSSESPTLPGKYAVNEKFFDHPMTPHFQRIENLANVYLKMGLLYDNNNDHVNGLTSKLKAKELATACGNTIMLSTVNLLLIRTYLSSHKIDSALEAAQTAYRLATAAGFKKYLGSILLNLGRIYAVKKNEELAAQYVRKAIDVSEENYPRGVVAGNLWLSDYHRKTGKLDSALFFARSALKVAGLLNDPGLELRCDTSLVAIYKKLGNRDSVLKYQESIIQINNNLFNTRQAQLFARIDFNEQQRQHEVEAEKKAYRNRVQTIGLLVGLGIFLLVATLLWRNNRVIQHSNTLLKEQKKETEVQKNKAENTLAELKSTQAQLIQSEKMASLGELTAGIAHEIQNPLNFVNNFSEVNVELADELQNEIKNGQQNAADALVHLIRENNLKISHHGKRADGIVKGMLQHSASAKGQRESADVNVLAEENLNLVYHKFRSRDESFQVVLLKELDKAPVLSYLVPQEMGRLMQNLFNNAFYAVSDKAKKQLNGYHPTITLRTRKANGEIIVQVEDNGNGIPGTILDKIFQPFYTTKPSGEGTGLGLSIAYDIMKSLGGSIVVDSVEGSFTRFTVRWPTEVNT